MSFSRVLVAVEDRKFAQGIEHFLSSLHLDEQSSVQVVHVIEPTEAVTRWPSQEYRKAAEALVLWMVERLRTQFPDIQVYGTIVEGFARESIIDTAQKWEADLIVVGAHNRNGLAKVLCGSVSNAVIAEAPCAIAVITPTAGHSTARVAEPSTASN